MSAIDVCKRVGCDAKCARDCGSRTKVHAGGEQVTQTRTRSKPTYIRKDTLPQYVIHLVISSNECDRCLQASRMRCKVCEGLRKSNGTARTRAITCIKCTLMANRRCKCIKNYITQTWLVIMQHKKKCLAHIFRRSYFQLDATSLARIVFQESTLHHVHLGRR